MKDFRNTVMEVAAKQLAGASPYIWLIEVRVPSDPPTRIRITNFDTPVIRGTDSGGHPKIYYPFPVAHGDLLQQTKGDLTDMTFNVANVTLELSALLDRYDGFTGQPVIIRLVHSDGIMDPDAEYRTDGKVLSCHVTDEVASFTISATNLTKALFPKRRMLAFDCGSTFGSTECGYVIPPGATNVLGFGFDFCPRELEACEERGQDELLRGLEQLHPRLFNAFPGMRSGSV